MSRRSSIRSPWPGLVVRRVAVGETVGHDQIEDIVGPEWLGPPRGLCHEFPGAADRLDPLPRPRIAQRPTSAPPGTVTSTKRALPPRPGSTLLDPNRPARDPNVGPGQTRPFDQKGESLPLARPTRMAVRSVPRPDPSGGHRDEHGEKRTARRRKDSQSHERRTPGDHSPVPASGPLPRACGISGRTDVVLDVRTSGTMRCDDTAFLSASYPSARVLSQWMLHDWSGMGKKVLAFPLSHEYLPMFIPARGSRGTREPESSYLTMDRHLCQSSVMSHSQH